MEPGIYIRTVLYRHAPPRVRLRIVYTQIVFVASPSHVVPSDALNGDTQGIQF